MNRWIQVIGRVKASLLIGALAVVVSGACSVTLGVPLAKILLAAGAAGALASQHFERGSWPLAVFWGLGAIGLLAAGREVDAYMLHIQRVPLPHPYPWLGVFTFLGVQAVEVGLLALVLRPRSYSSSWRRALSATVAFLGLGLYFGLRLMHAPPYVAFHWLWVLSGLVGCLLLFLLGVLGSRTLRAA